MHSAFKKEKNRQRRLQVKEQKAILTHVFEKNPGLQFPFHRQVL